jgi:hypothetical protein
MGKISEYDAITESTGLAATDNVLLQRSGANKITALSVLADYFDSGGGGGGVEGVSEFILHTSAGAITPTNPVVNVVVQANLTLPSITDTPRIVAMVAGGGNYTITCAASNYIYLVSSMPTSHTLANKEVLVLFSSGTSQNIWVPISSIADVSAI